MSCAKLEQPGGYNSRTLLLNFMAFPSEMAFSRVRAASLVTKVQKGLIIPPVHLLFSPSKTWPLPPAKSAPSPSNLRISVLDSSFNPPTHAHVALAKTRLPNARDDEAYDAKLLLLSVRNPDKAIKPGDATFVQRLEMMTLLAQELGENTAVAIIDEPLFFGKGKSLSSFLQNRLAELEADGALSSKPPCSLHFILGLDTLERVLSPKYYISQPHLTASSPETIASMRSALLTFVSPPPSGHDCRIVCARRDANSYPALTLEDGEPSPLSYAEDLVASGHISMIDIGRREQTFSSSGVRTKVEQGKSQEWQAMAPKAIASYIVENGLYGS